MSKLTLAQHIARYAVGLRYEDIPPNVIAYVKDLTLDTIGCALGGYLSEPSRIARKVVSATGGIPEATVVGSGQCLPAGQAALLNGIMVRYLDFNDMYFGAVGRGHHSEIMPCAWAVGERQWASGPDVLAATVVGYEIQCAMNEGFEMLGTPVHPVTQGAFAAPAVAGRLLGLSTDQVANAIGLSGSTSIVLQSWLTTTGDIPMIKAMGYPTTVESGIRAALLAGEGFTAPLNTLETFVKLVAPDADTSAIASIGDTFRLTGTMVKEFASQINTQAPIEATLALAREHGITAEQVQEVTVQASHAVASGLQASPGAYSPRTREAADHSIPYTLAMALLEGTVMPDQYLREQWKDPRVHALMKRVKCVVEPSMDAPPGQPQSLGAEVTIATTGGQSFARRVDYPFGHSRNPMPRAVLEGKFRALTRGLMGREQQDRVIEAVARLDELEDFGELMALLAV